MKLLAEGFGTQDRSWHVCENRFAGYSRVYYITGGELEYSDFHHQKMLKTDTLYIFPSHTPFELTHNPDRPLCCLWYHFDFFPAIITDVIPLEVGPSLKLILDALILENQEGCTDSAFYRNLVLALESYILETGKLPSPNNSLNRILHTIRDEYCRPSCSVTQLSAVLGYTPEHFIRLFQQWMNITPYQYITSLRMTKAVQLILSNVPVSQVAEQVGYKDYKVFARAFTTKYGIAPSRYKSHYQPTA